MRSKRDTYFSVDETVLAIFGSWVKAKLVNGSAKRVDSLVARELIMRAEVAGFGLWKTMYWIVGRARWIRSH